MKRIGYSSVRKAPLRCSGGRETLGITKKISEKIGGCFIPSLLEDRMTLPSCQQPRQCQAHQLQIIQHCSGLGMWETMGSCWRQLCLAPPGPPRFLYFWGSQNIIILPQHQFWLTSLLSEGKEMTSCTLSTLSFINSPGWDRWGKGAAPSVPSRLLMHHTATSFNLYMGSE